MMEVFKYLALSFLALMAIYILVRIVSRATFMSWFEVKKEHENKKEEEEN